MLLGQIKRAVERYKLLERGERVVVGVSGGPDSMALLHALRVMSRETGWRVHGAHLHHGLRGTAADRDLALVKAYAEGEGVPLTIERLAPESLDGPGVEARGRMLRYAFLHRVAERTGAERIATGHTMDDQAETVLLRLLRGSGTRGLAGIQPRRDDGVIRPLLLARRRSVIAFLKGAGIAYGEDETNRDARFLRNRVRHEVLPLLRTLSPRITERLASMADRLRADEAYLAAETNRVGRAWLDEGHATGPRRIAGGEREQLSKLPEALRSRVLMALLADAGAEPDRLADAIECIEAHLAPGATPGTVDLGGNLRVRWGAQGVFVERGARRDTGDAAQPLAVPGTTTLPDGRAIRATILSGAGEQRVSPETPVAGGAAGKAQALFDLADLTLPLAVRTRLPGDRMRPRGFGHWRKLKDVLIDARVPQAERDRVPLVVMGEEILWAAGVRASERGRPGPGPARRLFLELLGEGSAGAGIEPAREK